MLTDEEWEKLKDQYTKELVERQKIANLENKIKDCEEIIESFTSNNPWKAIRHVTLNWTECESDVEGRKAIDSTDKKLKIDDPSIFTEGIKKIIRKYKKQILMIKGEIPEKEFAKMDIELTELANELKEDEVTKEIDILIEKIIYLQTNYNLNLSGILEQARNIRNIYKRKSNNLKLEVK